MGNVVLMNPSDQEIVTFDWTDVLGTGGVTLNTVTHSVPAPLTKVSEATDAAHGLSQVKISGAVHGQLYQVAGAATLSNGETIKRTFPVRGMNS